MTPTEKARQMRADGATLVEVATALGVGTSTVQRWCKPDFAEQQRETSRRWKERHRDELRAYNETYDEAHRLTCPKCGQLMGKRSRRRAGQECRSCITRRRDANWARIEAMWAEGALMREIADAMGWTVSHLGVEITRMRKADRYMPHRRPRGGRPESDATLKEAA